MRRQAAIAVVLAMASPAVADDVIPGHSVDRPRDGAIQGLAIGVSLGAMLIPIRDRDPWQRELFEMDEGVKDKFSRRASAISDGLLGLSLAAPAIYLTGASIDDADGDKLMIYGQSVAINAALASVTKRLVQRPRPYTYSADPAVQHYAKDKGDDAMQSFYSGHSALSFGAATTGAYLLGASEENRTARVVAWTSGLAVASATATLRVRAGKHFYSDVIIGSLVGITVGYAVPALHADEGAYAPSGEEVAAGMAGILGGMMIASLLPLEKRNREPGTAPEKTSLLRTFQLAPAPMANGMGFAVGGSW
ncbi:MAG: phosphatase PAP2 family protein [Kofleriaceae bacterium]|nr:phosphatase PAP2 family protein [Kofleriaceae bacterium]